MSRATASDTRADRSMALGRAVVSERARALLPLPRFLSRLPILRELTWFWPVYLWHHRRPWTRRLHHLGSWSCVAGVVLAFALGAVWPLPAGLALGYLAAFLGHWVVERNRPLTFGYPILAGMCNWIMFSLELTGRLHRHLQVAREEVRDEWDAIDPGSE
jgi:hypothetical protein